MDTSRAIEELALFSPVKQFGNKACVSTMPHLSPRDEAIIRLQALYDAGWNLNDRIDLEGATRRIAAARMRKAIGVK